MKLRKRIYLILTGLIFFIILFRGFLYRHLITYKSERARISYVATDRHLIDGINKLKLSANCQNMDSIVDCTLDYTSQVLNFRVAKNDNDPNKLIYTKNAHCVGYAAFFAASCNYLLAKNKLDNYWIATPQVGQLYICGKNINKCIHSPFFKDHDFVLIENRITKETIAVDPTVDDYLWIHRVHFQK